MSLAACHKPVLRSDVGLQAGQYRITQYLIESDSGFHKDNLTQGTPEEFADFKQLLENRMPKLAQSIPAQPAREVGITITVNQLNLDINEVRAAVWADALQVWTKVTLWDAQTRQKVGELPVVAMSEVTAGPIGVLINSGGGAMKSQRLKEELVDLYIEKLTKALYPKK